MFTHKQLSIALEPHQITLAPSAEGDYNVVQGGRVVATFSPLKYLVRQWVNATAHDLLIQDAVRDVLIAVQAPPAAAAPAPTGEVTPLE